MKNDLAPVPRDCKSSSFPPVVAAGKATQITFFRPQRAKGSFCLKSTERKTLFPPRRLSMKKWLIALAALVILLAAGVIILLFSLNSITEKAVNTQGPKITGTAVHLDKADISLLSGTGTFSGFSVGNPAGFSGPDAATVGSVSARIDMGSVFKDVIIVHNVTVDSPHLIYELGKNTSNFDVILKNVESYADKNEGASDSMAASSGASDDASKKKVIIDELVIRNAKATLSVPLLKLNVNVPLPEIRLTDIGRKESGIGFAKTALIVGKEVTRTLAKEAEKQTKNVGDTLIKGGEKAGDKAKNLLKEGLGLFK